MFVINITYLVPLDVIDVHLIAHRDFLKHYYEQGTFIASGAKVPRTGGIILAVANSIARIQEIISEDPFNKPTLAKYEITEFAATMCQPELENLLKI